MSSKERPAPGQMQLKNHMRPVLIGVMCGVVACMACLVVFALVISSASVPQGAFEPMATFSITLGGFVGGFMCAKLNRSNGLLFGLLCGAVMAVILLLASFGFGDDGLGIPALFKIAFILLGSMLGGVLGVNTRSRRKKSRK